jgi:hypothetical protein
VAGSTRDQFAMTTNNSRHIFPVNQSQVYVKPVIWVRVYTGTASSEQHFSPVPAEQVSIFIEDNEPLRQRGRKRHHGRSPSRIL